MEEEFDYETNENTAFNSYADDTNQQGFFARNIWYFAGLAVLLLLGYFVYRYYFVKEEGGKKSKKGKKKIENENESESEDEEDYDYDDEETEEETVNNNRERIIERLERRLPAIPEEEEEEE